MNIPSTSGGVTSLLSQSRNRRITLGVVALILVILVPFYVSDFNVYLAQSVLIYGLVALALNIVLGYSGMVSFGHAAFLALGAYATAILVTRWNLPLPLVFLLAAFAAGVAGWLLGWVAARLSSHYLSIATLAFAAIVQKLLYEMPLTGGRDGIAVPPPVLFGLDLSATRSQYWLAVVVVLGSSVFAVGLLRGGMGRAWIAVKNSEVSASACGIDSGRYNVKAFTVSAGLTGLAGCLFAFQLTYLSVDAFNLRLSLDLLVAVVVGGMGSIFGSLFAGIFLVVIPQLMSGRPELEPVLYGVVIVVVVLLLPRGLAQCVELLPNRKRILAPRESSDRPVELPSSWEMKEVPALTLEHVGISFGGVQALKDLSFSVQPGSIVGLVGPNGAGKTTALNLMSGFARADKGRITLGDLDISRMPTHQLRQHGVGRSFQHALLFDDLTVLDNIMVGGHPELQLGVSSSGFWTKASRRREQELRTRAEDVLAVMGLTDRRDVKARELPFGERKLVDFARSVIGNPRVLLLDEPAAGLNTTETARFCEVVAAVNKATGCSILLIEHDMELVGTLCQQLVVLDFGVCIAEGDVDDVRNDPKVAEAYMGVNLDAAN